MASPNSYKDPYWSDLASSSEASNGLPKGVLVSILKNGERSNADQVSEANARTPFQITKDTRDAALKKWGIDAYLSDKNAADVAANLIKDSLTRNKGSVTEAVGEYHGGLNRDNWGPRTRAYIARVVNGSELKQPQQSGSTFDKVFADQKPVNPTMISQVYDAYKSGKMTPDESAQFEKDVKSGIVMLPKGASIDGSQPSTQANAPAATMLPQAVTDAYVNGKMSPQDRADLEADIKSGVVKLPPTQASQIPNNDPNFQAPTEQGVITQAPDPSLGQKAVGVGEAALATGTGMVSGAAGMLAGTVSGIAKSIIDGTYGTQQGVQNASQEAAGAAQAATYEPRTQTGQQYTQAVGDVAQAAIPVAGLPGEMASLGRGAHAAAPAVRAGTSVAAQGVADAVKPPVVNAVNAVKNAPQATMEAVGLRNPAEAPVATGGASVGAAATPEELLRTSKSQNLPVPVDLTKGAAGRDATQLAFEKEQMKGPLGGPLRDRANENNVQALQNFDALIDMTGAESPDLSATGNKVIKALSEGHKKAKTETNVAYTEAKKSPESKAPVDPNIVVKIGEGDNAIEGSVMDYINSKVQGVPSASVTDTARKIAVKLGIAEEGPDGNLIGKPTTVGKMEEFRKELSGTAKWDDKVGVRDETIIKKLVDAQTEPVAGPLYTKARQLRAEQARKFENRAVVARLITDKRGMADPMVTADQVFQKSILNGATEEITFLKRVLNTSGEEGQQAWKELQGATMQHIRDEATKAMGMDAHDRPIVSPAKLNQVVNQLDKNGRLDLMLGKKSAETVRDLNDVVRYVNTTPPGTLINNSGTVGTLLAAMAEAGTTGALTGLPVPAVSILRSLSKQIGNNKMKLKIQDALNSKSTGKF